MSIDSDVIRGHVDTIILKTLTTGDKYGYEIIKEIEQKSQGTYELKQPTLYSCLKRLENQGLISGYSKNSDIGGKRHYYKLTKKGRENYENSMQEWFNSKSIIDSLMGSTPPTQLEDANSPKTDDDIDTPNNSSIENEDNEDNIEASLEDKFVNIEPSAVPSSDDEKETAQMVIDESSSITQEVEPRNFETVNLDEDDVALLGDYYKTDENQIDLFASDESLINYQNDDSEIQQEVVEDFNEMDEIDNTDPIDTSTSETEAVAQFKNFSGADLTKYKNNSASNYFDSISSESHNYSSSFDFTPIVDDSRENDEHVIESEVEDESISENLSTSNSFSSFNYFGNFGQYDTSDDSDSETTDDEVTEDEDNVEEKREFVFPSFRINDEDEDNNEPERLHFGFGGYEEQDNDDNMSFPTTFDDVDDLDESSEFENEVHAPITIFGEEENSNIEDNEYYEDNEISENLSEPIYSTPETELYTRTYISEQTTDLKPINIGTYSEPEHKEKLNQLSSYTKMSYGTKPTDFSEETTRIESKSITELKEDFESLGIEIRNYKKPEREPLKDKKYLLVNKIKFATSWIVFGVMSLLLLGMYFLANNLGYNDLSLTMNSLPTYVYYIIAGVVAISIPITYTVIYLLNKTKKVKPNYNAVISLIFALLFFVVCLNIVYTFNILNGFTKFTQTDYNHLLWLLPSALSLIIVLQSIVYTILFKTRRFNA